MLRVYLLRVPKHRYVFYAHKNDFVAPEKEGPVPVPSLISKLQNVALTKLQETKEEIDSAPMGVGKFLFKEFLKYSRLFSFFLFSLMLFTFLHCFLFLFSILLYLFVGIKGKARQLLQKLEAHVMYILFSPIFCTFTVLLFTLLQVHPSEGTLHQMLKASKLEVMTITSSHSPEHMRALNRRSHRIMRLLLQRHETYHKKVILSSLFFISYLILSYLILSYLILSYLILSYLSILFYLLS
jgi:hypothetical protein